MTGAKGGVLIISLDFELYWGVRDKRTADEYKSNLNGVKESITGMLNLFDKYEIHATWATVGFLHAESIEELRDYYPEEKPSYDDINLSPYNYIEKQDNLHYDYHFAPKTIIKICKYKNQEVGTHTFSHYYCLEKGQNENQFDADILAAVRIANNNGIATDSIVFPRNQWNDKYLPIIHKHNISSYRGNEKSWMYKAENNKSEGLYKRGFRLIDAYFNLSGSNSYSIEDICKKKPYNIPSSRFLKPVLKVLPMFEKLRERRIIKSIKKAAINNEIFHLWWHPHNFGVNTQENLDFLEGILLYFSKMRDEYGMQSLNMKEVSAKIGNDE
jgi:peptidoglycan/xylan/chitin deacetylase (PgdA/CDA1 family)